jgi:aspartokinase
VGEDVRDTPGVAARATRAIGDIPLLLVSFGASDTSVSLVVSHEDVHEVVVKLHGEFFGEGVPEGMFARTDVEASL